MNADEFLSNYNEQVYMNSIKLREVILKSLPEVIEQVDLPAKMVAYCYGQKYVEMICTIIPSKKGVKLGFSYGRELPDPDKILTGTGKISLYVEIQSESQIKSAAIKKLLYEAMKAYKIRLKTISSK